MSKSRGESDGESVEFAVFSPSASSTNASMAPCPTSRGPRQLIHTAFRSTLLLYRDYSSRRVSPARLAVALTFFALLTYQIVHALHYSLSLEAISLSAPLTISCWLLQAWFTVIFTFYWQWTNQIISLIKYIESSGFEIFSDDPSRCKRLRKYYGAFAFAICLNATVHVLVLIVFYAGGDEAIDTLLDIKPEFFFIYGGRSMAFVSLAVSWFGIHCWSVIIGFYVFMSMSLFHEIKTYNSRLRRVGADDSSPSSIVASLQQLYEVQNSLAGLTTRINALFEVYNFVFIGTNIMSSAFALITLVQRLRRARFSSAAFLLPVLAFCGGEAVCLTLGPARIHSAIEDIQSSIFTNGALWRAHDSKIHETAHILVAHSKRPGFGISLWGIKVISKQLLLSTTSLLLTYLTILSELDRANNESAAATCDCLVNTTTSHGFH